MRTIYALLAVAGVALAGSDELKKAEDLYNRTDYHSSLAILETAPRDAAAWSLIGRDYFMLGDYKKATDAFQRAVALEPTRSEYVHWLGRTYGRRAETSSPLFAMGSATKARQCFERAVALDPKNAEALNDLFDYYLQAPGFMGGGYDKASEAARKIAELDPAEGHFAQALLADKKKEVNTAEDHLRRAAELAPRQVGRVLDLAKYLAKQRRYQESDAVFARAEQIAPNSPKVMFAKAKTLIEEKRKLEEARDLLKRYLNSSLTPEDPPREQAEKLLKEAETAGA
jgi:cytochrome c-type biogenesis protein CcmH/NrfG